MCMKNIRTDEGYKFPDGCEIYKVMIDIHGLLITPIQLTIPTNNILEASSEPLLLKKKLFTFEKDTLYSGAIHCYSNKDKAQLHVKSVNTDLQDYEEVKVGDVSCQLWKAKGYGYIANNDFEVGFRKVELIEKI